MSDYRIMKRIGSRWREELRDVVEAALPPTLRELLARLAAQESKRELERGGDDSGRRPHEPDGARTARRRR